MRASLFALDYSTHEAVKIFAAETPEGHAAVISLNEKIDRTDEGLQRDPKRLELRVQDGSPSIVLKGKDGRNRIVIGLDENDGPVIQVIDRDGNTKSLVK